VCAEGDGKPGGYGEALAMVAAGLDYLSAAAAAGEMPEPVLGEVLLGLEAAAARQAAARAAVLARFDAGDCHDSDGYQNSSSWLRDRAGMTGPAARRQVRQMRMLRSRPRLAAAMSEGWLRESYADRVVAWTKPLPADMLDTADALVLRVLRAGGDLEDVRLVVAAALASEQAQEPDPGDPGEGFDDRSVRLETTLDGAGSLTGSLTPEAAAALQAVLESLGKKRGKQDTRTGRQRHHDALLEACDLLAGAKMVPDRAGSDTRVDVHIPFAELVAMPEAEALTEAWLRARAGEHGWLLGKDAEAAACDALIVPIVTAAPDWPVITQMIDLVLDALGQHPIPGTGHHGDTGDGGPDTDPGTAKDQGADANGQPPVPLPPEARQALLYAMGKLAIQFVSGPGAIASVLRTGLLPSPFSTRSVPIDVGYSDHVPQAIRRAVIARARHCEWPGGCDRPPSACDVHHIRHKKDGGPTSVTDCALFCDFHHDVCIHRWGWEIELRADGTITATSPDGQVLRGHPPPATQPA
jgi:uncharacterized protein DUF222